MILLFKKLLPFTLIALVVSNVSYSNPAPSNNQLEGRPSNVPEDYVATPGGYKHPDCIQTLEDGDSINRNSEIVSKEGVVRDVAACAHDSFSKAGKKIDTTDNADISNFAGIKGWEADISRSLAKNNNMFEMSGEWTVPDALYKYSGQTLFIFNSISTDSTIIQPVLGYNQDGALGPHWSVAIWMVTSGQLVKKTKSVFVQPGDVIIGSLKREIPDGSAPEDIRKWTIYADVLSDGVQKSSQSLDIELPNSNYSTLQEGAYETYGATNCVEINKLKGFKPLEIVFKTKNLKSKNVDSGIGSRYADTIDRNCQVSVSLENWGVSKIHY